VRNPLVRFVFHYCAVERVDLQRKQLLRRFLAQEEYFVVEQALACGEVGDFGFFFHDALHFISHVTGLATLVEDVQVKGRWVLEVVNFVESTEDVVDE